MSLASRREFLARVGQGMLVASVGYGLARDVGLAPLFAADSADEGTLTFGALEPLVREIEETSADALLASVCRRLASGTTLEELVAAAALANARTFGGEDYVGFHTFMALAPAYRMAQALPKERRALPVLKVLHRNARRTAEVRGSGVEGLRRVEPAAPAVGEVSTPTESLRRLVHDRQRDASEARLAAIASRSPSEAFEALLGVVEDSAEVHRVVLAHRAWDMRTLAGEEHALTLLRQSVRYLVKNEEWSARHLGETRELLPKLLESHGLLGRSPGDRRVDDAWVERTSRELFVATPAAAAEIAAAALGEGIAMDEVAQAVSLAANQLVLRDAGRTGNQVQPNKPEGSVHGDSIGVHACDSANAWRNIARVSSSRNAFASTILSAYQVARDRVDRGGDFLEWEPRPTDADLEKVAARGPDALLADLDAAIRAGDQARACAVVECLGRAGGEPRPVVDRLLGYATSEDGALHAEKYFFTATDEFAGTRPAFRWRQLVALARVTASEHGVTAPGYEEACRLLRVPV